MRPEDARAQLEAVLKDFEARHWQTRRVFMTRYDEIEALLDLDGATIGDEKRQLIGAYFCHEYSYAARSEEHTSELQSLMRISYAVFCLKKKNTHSMHYTLHVLQFIYPTHTSSLHAYSHI